MSTRWVRAVGSALAAAMVWVVFVPYALPWLWATWATWAVLIVGTIVSLQRRSPRSVRELVDDSEGRPVPVVAVAPVPAGPAPRRWP